LFAALEEKGALIDCQSTKDTFLYASSCHVNDVKDIMKIIAGAVHRPIIDDASVEYAGQVIQFENEATERKPDCEPLLADWAHEAGFRGNTIGFSKYCRSSEIGNINRTHLYSYLSQYHTPDRIVVGGLLLAF
jgi:processing peptidase subunit alpha